eukprot:TRINITY_DN11648_c0_g2_i1.p1 TRINITY_DN11648_c0_g2~~TRINITY_DN11648_c0_g2_i1.p1  ORF type:complete len:130 (+),score=2.17 TRINITY_DN11648_c0_g2_i1:26-415(+)
MSASHNKFLWKKLVMWYYSGRTANYNMGKRKKSKQTKTKPVPDISPVALPNVQQEPAPLRDIKKMTHTVKEGKVILTAWVGTTEMPCFTWDDCVIEQNRIYYVGYLKQHNLDPKDVVKEPPKNGTCILL